MNRDAYKFIFSTYGKNWGVWFGFVAELIRAFIGRVVTVLILAGMAAAVSVGDFERSRELVVVWVVLTVSSGLFAAFGDLAAQRGENLTYEKAAREFYRKLATKDMAFYRSSKTGYLTAVFRQHIDSAMLLTRLLRGEAVRTGMSLTIPVIVMLLFDWRVGVVALAMLVVQVGYVFWSSTVANKYRQETHEIYRKVSGEVADDITNIVAYKASGRGATAEKRFKRLMHQEIVAFWKRRATVVFLNMPRTVLTTLLVGAAFWVAMDGSGDTGRSVETLVLTITYMFQIVRNVDDLPEYISRHDDLVTRLHPTLEIIGDMNESIRDPAKPKKLKALVGSIEIRNLSFTYQDDKAHTKVFKNLNLRFQKGERVGIVGLSGSGKSTLANLIMRFDEAQSGHILVGGIDTKEVLQSDLRSRIAYVPQEPILFHRTIRENIAYSDSKATDAEVKRAAKAAHAHSFIMELPNKYDTVVGERGVKLSGGQKQRVVIARAVLKRAPIILFDEATSALDSESEHIIQKALPEIIGSHTAIIIAHRLSTVANLDRIIVMHGGKIIEEGTHKQLLSKKGRYYSLWQRQTTDKLM